LHCGNPRESGPALTPVALHLRRMSLQHPDLATYRFGPSRSAPLARLCLRRLRRFTWVGRTTRPWPPTAAVLAVAISARTPIATLAGEDTLSRGLRTPPLPATHASVGDCWQNSRCRHLLMEEQHTSRDTLVSHPLHYRAALACSLIPPPLSHQRSLQSAFPHGEATGVTSFISSITPGSGRAFRPVARHPRRGTLQPPYLATYRFGPSLSASLACFCLRPLSALHLS